MSEVHPWPETLIEAMRNAPADLVWRRRAAECDPLPLNCPYANRFPQCETQAVEAVENETVPCCRIERVTWLGEDEPPLCRVEGEEVYRFLYMKPSGVRSSVRIAKRRDEITVERSDYAGESEEPERAATLLTTEDWDRLQSALSDANFWFLPRIVQPHGPSVDGLKLIVEARRGDRFQVTRFDNVDVPAFRELGRVAFALAWPIPAFR